MGAESDQSQTRQLLQPGEEGRAARSLRPLCAIPDSRRGGADANSKGHEHGSGGIRPKLHLPKGTRARGAERGKEREQQEAR